MRSLDEEQPRESEHPEHSEGDEDHRVLLDFEVRAPQILGDGESPDRRLDEAGDHQRAYGRPVAGLTVRSLSAKKKTTKTPIGTSQKMTVARLYVVMSKDRPGT